MRAHARYSCISIAPARWGLNPARRWAALLRGVGGLLVQAGVDRADDEGVGAYLENSKPRNTPFYARHGFTEGDPIALGTDAPQVLAMWRPPRV